MILLAWKYPDIDLNKRVSTINGVEQIFRDTIPKGSPNGLSAKYGKIIISNADSSGVEISPFDPNMNGVLIEPINRVTNAGITGNFYLKDTSSWNFYTNAQKRLSIGGDGSIETSAPVLINNAPADGQSSLRVNGSLRSDTAISIQGYSDSLSFISLSRNIKDGFFDPDDNVSPYSSTPISWAVGKNIPVFRIRHPNNVSGNSNINVSLQRDFKIYPYQYGMTIDYNGLVECWVGEWSIHRGLNYWDTEGNGNGWGGVLWVGDDSDVGGVRATARNNISQDPNLQYGELSVERFNATPLGDFRLRLPSTDNEFQFVYGGRGSKNVVAKVSSKGLIIPKVASQDLSSSPQPGQLTFDSTQNQFKGYDGASWLTIGGNNFLTGSTQMATDGVSVIFTIPHSLGSVPSYFNVIATSESAANFSYVTADANAIYVHYSTSPDPGKGNLSWNWMVKK